MFRPVATIVLLMACGSAAFGAEHTSDSIETIQENLSGGKAVLLDVREQSEWDAGHLKDAELVPLSELEAGIDEDKLKQKAPEGKIVYTHCRSGRRSVKAAEILEKLGYDVRPLKQGYQDLVDVGFEQAEMAIRRR